MVSIGNREIIFEIKFIFVKTVSEHPTIIRLASIIIAMLSYTLREVPENAEHIEKIIFHESVDLVPLLRCQDPMLK